MLQKPREQTTNTWRKAFRGITEPDQEAPTIDSLGTLHPTDQGFLEKRGEIDVKGKGKMTTFFVSAAP